MFEREDNPRILRAQIEEVIRHYGEIAATVAADYYDTLRELDSPQGKQFTALVAAAATAEQFRINLTWALAPISSTAVAVGKAFDDAYGRAVQVADRMAINQGRDTISKSALADPHEPRWARVPTGQETCAFCLVLASRGFVYESEATAGGGLESNSFHSGDDCVQVLSWSDDPVLENYDPEDFYSKYMDARNAAGSGDLNDITAKLREMGITER